MNFPEDFWSEPYIDSEKYSVDSKSGKKIFQGPSFVLLQSCQYFMFSLYLI